MYWQKILRATHRINALNDGLIEEKKPNHRRVNP